MSVDISRGKIPASSHSSAWGLSSRSTTVRRARRKASCSDVSQGEAPGMREYYSVSESNSSVTFRLRLCSRRWPRLPLNQQDSHDRHHEAGHLQRGDLLAQEVVRQEGRPERREAQQRV